MAVHGCCNDVNRVQLHTNPKKLKTQVMSSESITIFESINVSIIEGGWSARMWDQIIMTILYKIYHVPYDIQYTLFHVKVAIKNNEAAQSS